MSAGLLPNPQLELSGLSVWYALTALFAGIEKCSCLLTWYSLGMTLKMYRRSFLATVALMKVRVRSMNFESTPYFIW